MKTKYSLVLLFLIAVQLMYSQNMEGIVQNHLSKVQAKAEFGQKEVPEWKISDIVPSLNPEIQHVYLRQYYHGIEIYDAGYKLTVKNNQVTWKIDQFVKDVKSKVVATKGSLSPKSAILKVVRAHNLVTPRLANTSRTKDGVLLFKDCGITADNEPIKVKPIYQIDKIENKLRLAWNVSIYQKNGQHWWNENVDANSGKILSSYDWVISCNFGTSDSNHLGHNHNAAHTSPLFHTETAPEGPSEAILAGSYNVYAMPVESPSHGGRSNVSNPDDPTASPFGWHDTDGRNGAEFTTTRGNNVLAQDDSDGNNGTPGFRPDGGSALNFNFPINLNQAPSTFRSAAITNLFYWNNIMHDVFYQYGFNEASGNFQENNYGKGGRGSDSVNADAQDGSGTNNANFATPGDGSNPRMQMFLFTNPTRDGDLDNVIIAHEYGHGISTRLVGGPSANRLGGSEQMGEGWSDWFGLMLTMTASDTGAKRRGVGTYAIGQPTTGNGIRPTVYSTDRSINNTDYSKIGSLSVPHGVGYSFASILWDMTWLLIDQEGFSSDFYNGTAGNNIALALVTEGLKNTANNPGFVSGRDGILQADQDLYNGKYNCLIWTAFSERGVGLNANENNNGGTNSNTDQTVSFVTGCTDNPPPPTDTDCSGNVSTFPYTESFEGNIGAWEQASGDDLNWTVNSNGTPSNDTGPSAAIDGNSYIYLEVSGDGQGFPNKRGILNSPCINLSGETAPSLSFNYHMIGNAVGTLSVEARINNTGNWTSIFTRTGAQGTDWNLAEVDLSAYAGEAVVQLRINAVSGNSWQGDIAIDALTISGAPDNPPTGCSATVSSFPYSESFEGNIGAWRQTTGDDLDWTVDANGTPSNGTGPSTAVDGNSYIYLEVSGNGDGFPNKRGILNSPCFDLTGVDSPSLNFSYHMIGNAVGTLTVEARTSSTGTWTSIFSRSGAQGTGWNTASVALTTYANEASLQLRLNAISGTSWQGDIAIDALSISGTTDNPPSDCGQIDFGSAQITSFSNQDSDGTFEIAGGGTGLILRNNTWKQIPLNYVVTANTILEFDFQSTSQGEIHGVGFEDDNALSPDFYFKVHGTQNYGVTNFDNYSGTGTTTYTIPVGNFYTGSTDRLVFINDNDGGSGNNSLFSNVRIYEGSCNGSLSAEEIIAQLDNKSSLMGDEDEGLGTIKMTPNPTGDQFTLNVSSKNAKEMTVSIYTILGQRKHQARLNPGVNNFSAAHLSLSTGVYIVKIQSQGNQDVVKKLIVK